MLQKYDINNETRYFKDKKDLIENGLWQPCLVYNYVRKLGYKKTESIGLQFTANQVFDNEQDAVFYLGIYAQELVDQGDLPKEVIIEEDGRKRLDETKVKPMLKKLTFGIMETNDKNKN